MFELKVWKHCRTSFFFRIRGFSLTLIEWKGNGFSFSSKNGSGSLTLEMQLKVVNEFEIRTVFHDCLSIGRRVGRLMLYDKEVHIKQMLFGRLTGNKHWGLLEEVDFYGMKNVHDHDCSLLQLYKRAGPWGGCKKTNLVNVTAT